MSASIDEILLKEVGKFTQVDWRLAKEQLPKSFDKNAKFSYVYVLLVEEHGLRVPFYIGQTGRLAGRVNDYKLGSFSAATDFRVNRAIHFFGDPHQCNIHLLYREFALNKAEEKRLIREFFLNGFPLLNHLSAYDYLHANQQEEEEAIRRYCVMALELARAKKAVE